MISPAFDILGAERWSALGPSPVIAVPAADHGLPKQSGGVRLRSVIIGTDASGDLPPIDPDTFDVLLTTLPNAPAPWVPVNRDRFKDHVSTLTALVEAAPLAATTLVRQLRMAEKLDFDAALELESLTYSVLLGGAEFRSWLKLRKNVGSVTEGKIRQHRTTDALVIELDSPEGRNAMAASMRDVLFEALANAIDDPTAPLVTITAQGASFSVGGDLNEFGTAKDLAAAHITRSVRSVARLIDMLGPRMTVSFHGACIGSGLEPFVAAGRIAARRDTWFQLPELGMGLIPGAGGTVTVPRRIGRHRAGWLMLTGHRLRAARALEWGLIDEITE